MIDAMKVVDFKNYCKHVSFPIISYLRMEEDIPWKKVISMKS